MQNDNGGWSLFYGHEFDKSASVKAYYALKRAGDSGDAPHMKKAREAMLARGGAGKANVFTRIMLALFGQLEWKAVPMMPVEIMLLPRWFPFHLTKVSYWARTVIVPLLVLMTYKPLAKNPRGIGVRELFIEDPKPIGPTPKAAHQSQLWFTSFDIIDRVLRLADPLFPKAMRKRAIARAEAFVTERLNGVDGLGAIFPAMVNSIIMYDVLGYPESHPNRRIARESIERLLVIKDDEAYCQPCVSPVWDTALAAHTMIESGQAADLEAAKASLDWLLPRQVLDVKGDWADKRPNVRPGGSACIASTAAGRRSTPIISNIISTTFRSRITVRCSTRRPTTSPRAASRCWRSLAIRFRPASQCGAASNICARPNSRTAPGSAVGASITSTAPGRCCVP